MKVLNLQELIEEVRTDGDFRNQSYYTDAQITRKLNKHFKTIYKKYCDADLGFFVKTFDSISLFQQKAILLPDNFYKLSSLDKASINGFIPVKKLNFSGRENYQFDDTLTSDFFIEDVKFYFEDESIRILPLNQTSGIYRMRYYPEAPFIESGTARMYEEHTDYITYKTIADLKMMSEEPWQHFSLRAQEVMVSLERQLSERSLDIPELIADVYAEGEHSNLHYDIAVNSFLPAEGDSQPQVEQQADDGTQLDPLDFCFEFEEIPYVLEKPSRGISGVVNRGFDNFDSLTMNVRNRLEEIIFTQILESQTFIVDLEGQDSFDDFKDYRVDIDGAIEDVLTDRIETAVKSFYVKHLFTPYSQKDVIINPQAGVNPKTGITDVYGLSLENQVEDATRVISDDFFGTYDESSFIYSGLSGELRDIQWIGIYKKNNQNFFSVIFRREGAIDATAVSEYKIYLDNGELISLDLTANNIVSGSSPTVIIEKPLAINNENYEKLLESNSWRIFFVPRSSWYIGQNFGRRRYIEGQVETTVRRVKQSTLTHLASDKRPLDSFDGNILNSARLNSDLEVNAQRLHQVSFSYAAIATMNSIIFGLKAIDGSEIDQLSCVERITFFNVKSDNTMEITTHTNNIELMNINDKVLLRPKGYELPINFKKSVPRLYSPQAIQEVGNIQVEFRDGTDIVTTRQIPYGHESVINEYSLAGVQDVDRVRFQITQPSTGADAEGFIPTRVYLNYWNDSNSLVYVEITAQNTDVNLTNFDKERPINVAIA